MHYFISDLHLGFTERKTDKLREDLLLSFLDKIVPDCEVLYIVGDLFDYWFEYNRVIPKYFYRTLAKFAEMTSKGIKIEYIMGNHDFGHIDFFEEELGIKVNKDDFPTLIKGKKFYISHGDGKAYNDTGYLILRAILRNSFSIKLFKKLHPDFGIWLASGSSKKSRLHTDTKDYGNQKDGMTDFAKKMIDEGFDYVIMGHRHKMIELPHNNGYYYNLGDWLNDNPYFGQFDGTDFKMIELKQYLRGD